MNKENLKAEFTKINAHSNLGDHQDYIAKMMEVHGWRNTSLELFCYLTEEVGELAKEIRKMENNMVMDSQKAYSSSLEDEIADVFIY